METNGPNEINFEFDVDQEKFERELSDLSLSDLMKATEGIDQIHDTYFRHKELDMREEEHIRLCESGESVIWDDVQRQSIRMEAG